MNMLLQANHVLLKEAAVLIASMDDSFYSQPMPAFASGSIGQHIRHVLDHYQAVVNVANGVIDYDRRRRDVRLESCKQLALAEIQQTIDVLTHLEDGAVRVHSEVSPSDKVVVEVHSTIKRELLFVTSHAVHHFALIALLLRLQGVVVPDSFGVAPATLTHQRTHCSAM